jgi:hypothetical protein
MPTVADFRSLPFQPRNVSSSGKLVAQSAYWRLYAIENLFRIIVHSVLSVQIQTNWWPLVISPQKDRKVQGIKQDYANQPGSTLPGNHDIYYLFLSDLTKIITDHSNSFVVFIPNINQWIINLEQIRLPRNIVGHMNWPSVMDRRQIDKIYRDAKSLMRQFSNSGIGIIIP